MRSLTEKRNHFGRRLPGGAIVACLGLAAVCWLGCESRQPETPEKPQPAPSAKTPDVPTPPLGPRHVPALDTPVPTDTTRQVPSADDAGQSSARDVLESMVRAYKNAPSYADGGYMVLDGRRLGDKPLNVRGNYLVAFVRPNKIRLHVFEGVAICDGRTFRAYVSGIPNQVLQRDAPAVVDLASIFSNSVLADSMAQGPTQSFAWVPLQLILLLADDPLKTLLHDARRITLLEPGTVEDCPCHRVEIERPDGTGVFWIDQNTFVLRRFEFPVKDLQKAVLGGQVEDLKLTVEFASAQLGGNVDPKAFTYEAPESAELVDALAPSGVQMLGKPASDFILVGTDGIPVTLTSLSGKIAVIQCFSASDAACREMLTELGKVHRAYRDNDRVKCLAVSLDATQVSNETILKVVDELGVRVPILRDSERHAPVAFNITRYLPVTVVIGPKGIVQDYQVGGAPGWSVELSGRLKRLLAGENVYSDKLDMFRAMTTQYEQVFEEMVRRDLYISPMAMLHELPQAGIAEKTSPQRLKLQPLWKCNALTAPGNILVVPQHAHDKRGHGTQPDGTQPDDPPRIFVVDAGKQMAEIGPQGDVIATYPLGIPEQEYVSFVRTAVGRTAVGADAKRYFVGFAPMMQQFHLFDAEWKLLLSYPPQAHEHPHAGIGDVQIGDLDGDGTLELFAGYRGLVGVKAVSLGGEPLWSLRSIAGVQRMALTGPNADRRRELLCTNDRVSLAAIDFQGNVRGEVALAGRLLYWITVADLDGDGRPELCGLTAPELGHNLAVGLNTRGDLLWSYELPQGSPPPWLEQIAAAKLAPGGPACWLLAGADGSIHFVSADGKPIDCFNYGAAVSGLAVVELDGRPALLISSPQGLEAQAVEVPMP